MAHYALMNILMRCMKRRFSSDSVAEGQAIVKNGEEISIFGQCIERSSPRRLSYSLSGFI